jgi:hypothetical protein
MVTPLFVEHEDYISLFLTSPLQPSIKAAQHPLHRFSRFLSLSFIDIYPLFNLWGGTEGK